MYPRNRSVYQIIVLIVNLQFRGQLKWKLKKKHVGFLFSSADNLCKQFEPRYGLLKQQALSVSKLIDSLMAFREEFFENIHFF